RGEDPGAPLLPPREPALAAIRDARASAAGAGLVLLRRVRRGSPPLDRGAPRGALARVERARPRVLPPAARVGGTPHRVLLVLGLEAPRLRAAVLPGDGHPGGAGPRGSRARRPGRDRADAGGARRGGRAPRPSAPRARDPRGSAGRRSALAARLPGVRPLGVGGVRGDALANRMGGHRRTRRLGRD